MNSWQHLALDLAVLAAVTVLAALGKLPVEVTIAVVSTIAGGRMAQRGMGGPPDPPAGGAAKLLTGGAVGAIMLGLLSLARVRA